MTARYSPPSAMPGRTASRLSDFGSSTVVEPGQVVYVRDLETGETDAPGFAPFQCADATYDVVYEPGVATFAKSRGDLTMEYVVFVSPDFPGDTRILTLRNHGTSAKRLRVAPFFDLALEESPNESVDKIRDETVGSTLLFQNPRNDFERGFAFAGTSLTRPATETIRTRFFGGPGRNVHSPAMVETGSPDGAARDDGRRVAAFCGEICTRAGRRGENRHRVRPGPELGRGGCCRVSRGSLERGCGTRRDPRFVGRAVGQIRGSHQPAGLRSSRQHLAALPTLRFAALRPRRAQPARRRDGLSRSVAGRVAADSARTSPGARADRVARRPTVSRRRCAQMVASRTERPDGPRSADQGERPSPLAALCSRALCA